MAYSLTKAKQFANLTHIAGIYQGYVVEITFLLFGLLGENVAVVSVVALNLARAGERKTLLCTGVGLYLWHFFVCC